VDVRWSSNGLYFATAGHDQTTRIFGPKPGSSSSASSASSSSSYSSSSSSSSSSEKQSETKEKFPGESKFLPELICLQELSFKGSVEAIAWLTAVNYSPSSSMASRPTGSSVSSSARTLVVAVRDDNYLHYIDTEDGKEINRYNMNAVGDDHVSFSALHINSSPNQEYLLVSTDLHRLIMFECGGAKQVRNFFGSVNDQYSHPVNCWSSEGRYVYSTSQDKAVYVWDVVTEKIIKKLEGHRQGVRNLDHHPTQSLLLSCSFDGFVNLWSA